MSYLCSNRAVDFALIIMARNKTPVAVKKIHFKGTVATLTPLISIDKFNDLYDRMCTSNIQIDVRDKMVNNFRNFKAPEKRRGKITFFYVPVRNSICIQSCIV